MSTNTGNEVVRVPKPTAALLEETTIVRTIGVEIESLISEPDYDAINETGATYSGDGSIDGDGEGIEIQTPPLSSAEAEGMIHDVCQVLGEQGAEQNSSCGVHVHVDARELSMRSVARMWFKNSGELQSDETLIYMHQNVFANISRESDMLAEVVEAVELGEMRDAHGEHGAGKVLKMYGEHRFKVSSVDGGYIIPTEKYGEYRTFAVKTREAHNLRTRLFNAMRFFSAVDPILRGLIPASSRHNSYCQPFEKMARSGGVMPRTYREQLTGIADRYCGINMQSLAKHGTIENRYHGGTLSADKIIHWARLWERCVDVAISGYASEEADALSQVLNSRNRLDMLLALTQLPEGTCNYLRERNTAFMGSDAKHAIAYIERKGKKNKAPLPEYRGLDARTS